MDNLFLVRDTLDICKLFDAEVGLIALDQEKAFDRVDHNYLFNLLVVFGFGQGLSNGYNCYILELLVWLRWEVV